MTRHLPTRRFLGAAVGLMIGVFAAAVYFFAWPAVTGSNVRFVESQDERPQLLDENAADSGFDPEVADPSYSPRDVVGLQLASLRAAIVDPAQMRVCFSLASPENRVLTGPLSRFVNLFRGQAYRPLLGHQSAMIGKVRARGDQADMMVSVIAEDGQSYAYQFLLSRQTQVDTLDTVDEVDAFREIEPIDDGTEVEPLDDSGKCWLTHSVYPVPVATILPNRTTEP